ncbi:epoxide hydrolase 1-like [Curcuma longa]|uniref:epoxide hydrolase 1-like n=1 Tax=Curcuma longa TaxID=136217 RepID=UPI003D9DD987
MMEADGIVHRMVQANGITVHVAEKGETGAPVVVLLHGFAELWYSWRHQILGLAGRGCRAVAPDLRGYGDTSAPPSVASYSLFHIVGDLIALFDALSIPQALLVGNGWGAMVAWQTSIVRPDRVKAMVILSMPFMPRNPSVKPVAHFRSLYGDDYYVCKFQEPGKMEAEFDRIGTENVLRSLYSHHDPKTPVMSEEDLAKPKETTLPAWLTEHDFAYFASKFEKSGFTGPLNYYRCLDLNWELGAIWSGTKIEVPVKFIVGDQDLAYHYKGIQDYIHKGGFKGDVPQLEEVVVMEGVGHFINQEKPDEITDHIYEFISKFF